MNIIGLGSAGCAIADSFSKFPQYNIYKLDTGIKGEGCFNIPKQRNHQQYEENCPSFAKQFERIQGDSIFVLAGGGDISGCCLRVLQELSHNPTEILYIQPDIQLLSERQIKQERIVYNILQEYARSGLVERIYLISNLQMQEILGDVSIMEYYSAINQAIVNTFHMITVFNRSEAVLGTFTRPAEISRVSTVGILDLENGEESWFFNLKIPRDVVYYYGINEEELKTDEKLFKNITTFVKNKVEDNLNVSYGVYKTNYEQKYCYCVKHSSVVQSYIDILDDQDIS